MLPDEERLHALEAATVVVVPSPYESLSLLALEAFAVGTPVLANARAEVLVDHCRRSNAGLYYADRWEFIEGAEAAAARRRRSAPRWASNGKAYVNRHYRWSIILNKYERMFARLRGPARAARRASVSANASASTGTGVEREIGRTAAAMAVERGMHRPVARCHARVRADRGATGPSIKVGTTLFANYSYTFAPKTADATGREVSPSSFDITRAYLTITGDITPRVSFRLTSDVVRETGSGGSLDGSLVLRLKYAYMQLSLAPWLGPHTWVRFGLQNTPITYAIDQIYRYRFQGSPVPERDAGLSSSDAGASLHLDLPGGHGDVHAAVLNGEGYTHAETNGEKALQVRTTYKPVTEDSPLKGISLQLVVNYDHYAADLPRHRVLASAFYEHRRFNAGLDVLGTRDQPDVRRHR